MEKNQTDTQELTRVLHGTDATTTVRLSTISDAITRLDICDDAFGTVSLVKFHDFKRAVKDASRRGVIVRFITEITPENLQSCKELTDFVDLRHLASVQGNFAVTENQYYAFAPLGEAGIPTEVISSTVRRLVEQNQYLFDVLWNIAIPATARIKELEQGSEHIETKVISGREAVGQELQNFIHRIETKKNTTELFLFAASDKRIPEDHEEYLKFIKRLKEKNSDAQILFITDIQIENLEYVKSQIREGVIVRHVDRNKISFVVSNDEYIAGSPIMDDRVSPDIQSEIIWSNNLDVLSQVVQMFEMLWETAIPGEQRIRQLEEGVGDVELGVTRIIRSMDESYALGSKLLEETKEEILIILASEKTIARNTSLYTELLKKPKERGLRVRILAPIADNSKARDLIGDVDWRPIEPINVGFAIYDQRKMLITQYLDPRALDHSGAFISNIYTTNSQTIAGIVSIFEALWNESDLRRRESVAREREAKSRRQAQLLQDILTHDIRNYNQVSRLTAELMKEESLGNKIIGELADSLLASIDGSTSLVDRARSLGRIVSEQNPRLHDINLEGAIDTSLQLVQKTFPSKHIVLEKTLDQSFEVNGRFGRIFVLADDLITEVFSNIFSNSAKYSEDSEVRIRVLVSKEEPKGEAEKESKKMNYVKILTSDLGRGIPEEIQGNLFNRYLVGAKGSGLGLSIVHALVVDRYHGRINMRNNVVGKGVAVEMCLPQA